MNHLSPGLLSVYNSLTDKHLAGYFSNTRIRRHLQRAGLITRSGRIVPDKEYRHKVIQRAHQRHVRECLAQAIFHKVLEMERLHQIEIKRKLEEFARRERVHKIKLERSRRYEEDIIRILSPRPPTGARGARKQHSGPEGDHSESSESLGSSRPNTAPGKMQRPVRLKPIHSGSTTATLRRSSPYRLLKSANDNEPLFNGTESRRCLTTKETSNGASPYCLPVINNFVTPVPPATKRKERGVKVTPSGALRGRRLRPTTATSGADVNEDRPVLRSSVQQSRVSVNMVYFGKTVHLSHDMIDMRDEVKVFQQHCGGENLCVYKGKLREGESFQIISRRHRGFPFSLTFFLNGLQVERLSACCEFKHRKGSRLGGRHGHFGLFSVEGASPCYKCIIAMGLDKKPTPPPRRLQEEGSSEVSVSVSVSSPKEAAEMETERTGEEDTSSHSDCETRRGPVKATAEDKAREDYEEDFEADDEGPVEDGQEKVPLSASSDTESQVKDTSETQEDDKDDDIKSRSGSSCSGSDQEVSDAEDTKDSREDEKADREVSVAPSDEKDKLNPGDEAAAAAAAATVDESSVARDSDLQHSAGDTSVPSGQGHRQNDDTAESRGDEEKRDEEEQEGDNSVQEKITEAILNETQNSNTKLEEEEEEEAKDKGHEQDNDVPEKSVTFEEQEDQALAEEEPESKESATVVEAEVVQVQEDTPEPIKEDCVSEKELHENSDRAQDEVVTKEEEDEKPASDDAEEKDKSEDTGAAAQAASEENAIEEPKTTEPLDEEGAEGTDAKDGEQEEKRAEAAEAETTDADVSSVSERVKNTDEKAVSDTAEEEEVMTASKTEEMKAEPSEEQEAISCEEAPVTDTEEKQQQRDSTDTPAATQTGGVTAEDSQSSHSRESVVENTAGVREENDKEEAREEEEEEADTGKEVEESVEINSVIERGSKEEEKQTESDELAHGENSDGKEKNETDGQEETVNDESMVEEMIENEENKAEDTKSDKPAEKSAEEDNESEKTERDENKNKEDESRAKEAATDQANEGEEITETEAEVNEDKDVNGSKHEPSEQGNKEPEGENLKSEAGEGTSQMNEEPEKNTDHIQTADENTAESEDVGDNEAADVNKTPGEMSDNAVESDDAKKETEGASAKSEKGDVDAENGEISNRGEMDSHGDETEASGEDEKDAKTAERVEGEGKTERVPTEEESTEVKEESDDDGDGRECFEKQESELENKPNSDREESEDTKQDEDNTADLNNEDRDSTKNKDNISDMIVASLADQARSSTPTALKSDEYTVISDKPSHAVENPAGDGEDGADAEEVSKASEEGASVLLKPRAANDEVKVAEQSVTIAAETPEDLANEDRTDLVTNWVNMHQESKFFKTFVEPFDELRDDASHAQGSTASAEQQRLESPLERARTSKCEENEQMEKDESEGREKDDLEAVESDLQGEQSDDKPREKDRNSLLEKEETEVLIQKTGSEDSDKDSTKRRRKGSKGSVEEEDETEDKVQDEPMQSDVFKTEVESIAGTHHSVASGKPKSEGKTIDHGPDSNEKQTDIEGTRSQTPAEEHHGRSVSPDGPKDTEETRGETDQPSGEVTEITDFTTSKSDNGSQEESHNGGASGGSADKELIQDIKHTPSKDRLSSFSVDETLFGHSSHPLLNAARTESLH